MKKQLVLRAAPYLLLVPGLVGCNALALPTEAILPTGAGSPQAVSISKDEKFATTNAGRTPQAQLFNVKEPTLAAWD